MRIALDRTYLEIDRDLVGALDDVVVGDDVAVGRDDEAGAEGVRALLAALAGLAVHEVAEEVLERRARRQDRTHAVVDAGHHRRRGDVDDGGSGGRRARRSSPARSAAPDRRERRRVAALGRALGGERRGEAEREREGEAPRERSRKPMQCLCPPGAPAAAPRAQSCCRHPSAGRFAPAAVRP